MDWYWYRQNEKNEAVLLRVFGTCPEVFLPERIGGMPVTELSRYCFSEKESYTGEEKFLLIAKGDAPAEQEEKALFYELLWKGEICALAGDFITSVFFPGKLKKIGDLAFYQCHHLESIFLGSGEILPGSDAFMNCLKLKKFFLYTSPGRPTGLRQILAQRSMETEVYFLSEKEMVTAAVLFPEYSERYDLIGPAHIFELNIEGEGFRARQCFENGVFLFSFYDRIFPQACDTEEEITLCKMAMLRLRYPFLLTAKAEEDYRSYLFSHLDCLFQEMIRERDLELLRFFEEQEAVDEKQFERCLETAVEAQWIEGVRLLLSWKEEWRKEKKEDFYEFEEFS